MSEDDVRISSRIRVPFKLTIQYNFQAFQIVEKQPFRRLLQYLRPTLSDSDIPHRTKTRDEVMARADIVVRKVREKLGVCAILLTSPLHKY